MSVKHIILGSLMNGPAHGYSLRSGMVSKVLEEFGINDGQLYPLLKKMTSEGLIVKEIEYRDSGPNRHNYHITPAGRSEFIEWLKGSDEEERGFRYEMIRKDGFLNKCMYFGFLESDFSIEKITRQLAETQATIEDFQKAYDDMKSRGFDPVHLLIVKYGIMSQETRLKWLMELKDEFSSRAKLKAKKK
ncbi:MAG TPA: helix-turn-helix transcriptional regulator [Spirochaetota bacterium]|nr:helix-turn-helix transcriptional regulator [Spirochaetota bacterium]